jgi:hypothetical protein
MSVVRSDFKDVVFHDTATVAANGTIFEVEEFKTLTVEIFGTSTGRTVTFYAKSASGTLRPLVGTKISASPISTAISTTGTGELWQFDITGLHSIIMDLTAITDNNVSVKGRAVS